jgi:hypothetical protein
MDTTTLNGNSFGAFDNISNFDSTAYLELSPELDWGKPSEILGGAADNTTTTLSLRSGSLAWLGINWESLSDQYPDRWVLIDNQQVIADSHDATELERIAEERGIQEPFITKIEPVSAVWRTAYAHKGV